MSTAPQHPDPPPVRRPRAVFDPPRIAEIRTSPASPKSLALRYGVHVETIRRIRRGDTYADVPPLPDGSSRRSG